MNNPLLIHANNVPENTINDTIVFHFDPISHKNIDDYISREIIGGISKEKCNVIYIKDNLSSNYLELYGLMVAYHIRLSQELKGIQYLPIVILSDMDGYTLNKLSPLARILLTKNIFLVPNTKKSIEKFNKKDIQPLTEEAYEKEFLNLIEVSAPENSTSHSIANKWAIDRWAIFLKVESDKIKTNRKKISSMLYFKYLVAKNSIFDTSFDDLCVYPINSGKILFIDDEWDKGWGDIFEEYFSLNQENEFIIYNNDNKGISLISVDVVILDLRISEKDHNKDTKIEELTGIQFAKKIKKENPGIQIIMFTATGNSLILEELYQHDILGYIKKGHPEDMNIKTKESFAKLAALVYDGFEKKYLKEVWKIQKSILELKILEDDDKFGNIKLEIEIIFEILNSNVENKIKFTLITIFKILEILTEMKKLTGNEFQKIKRLFHNYELTDFDTDISQIVCTRNLLIHSGNKEKLDNNCTNNQELIEIPDKNNILKWFNMLREILIEINKEKIHD